MTNISRKTQKTFLHITNDIATRERLKASGLSGEFLAWQDVLYEGPIVSAENLTQLSRRRANYFTRIGWIDKDEIYERYQIRNKTLFAYREYEEVVLWFDLDINSQWQQVQIINWFSLHKLDSIIFSMVSIDRYPGMSNYLGIGLMNDEKIMQLFASRTEITLGQMKICRQAWSALGSENPNALLRFYHSNNVTMPHLKNTILRTLKQFPSQRNGLSQTELLIANAILKGHQDSEEIYLYVQAREAIPFMNRAIFTYYLQNMSQGKSPLINHIVIESDKALEFDDQGEFEEITVTQQIKISLTHIGRQVLHNWVDWAQVNGIHRWVGGVELSEGSLWRYDENKRKLIKTYV